MFNQMERNLNVIAVIPARYASTRFPYKLMQMLGDKTVIRRTYENTVATGLFDDVWVVTDSELIRDEIVSHGGKAMMSNKTHESGSDRIAEAVEDMEVELIINVQGDEPFIDKKSLAALIDIFKDKDVHVASLMKPFTDSRLIQDPNYVKVVVDHQMNSLLFSRSIIPYPRDTSMTITHYEHVGVYAFRKNALLQFTQWSPTPLELAEKIECLRYLENGIPLRMVITSHEGVKIDMPEDLEKAERYLARQNNR
jgi:3-deoxy-manno-octulosonate cytidylyltransferase (CMP-KDO synthetase)